MKTKSVLTAEDASHMVEACKKEAALNKWNVSIAVVDEGGFLLHFVRSDGVGLKTPEIAMLKASSAAISKRPTKLLEEMVKERPAFLKIPGWLAVQGGLPILYNGEVVGAIGVSGAKSHEDEQVAQAGISAFQALLGE